MRGQLRHATDHGLERHANAYASVLSVGARYLRSRRSTARGATERVILRETARMHGLKSDEALFQRFARALGDVHVRRASDLRERGHALPGAAALLAALDARNEVTQTAVTGNVRAAAEVKLAIFGLDAYADLGIAAFGEDGEERSDLVKTALARAKTPAHRAVLLGDTPADVAGALAAGVRVTGVATGKTVSAELRAAGAVAVVEDLSETHQMVDLFTDS